MWSSSPSIAWSDLASSLLEHCCGGVDWGPRYTFLYTSSRTIRASRTKGAYRGTLKAGARDHAGERSNAEMRNIENVHVATHGRSSRRSKGDRRFASDSCEPMTAQAVYLSNHWKGTEGEQDLWDLDMS
jgi:hypothetical protein